jgi:fermentation-respiration switch protein FrsA (DUF1100 family)
MSRPTRILLAVLAMVTAAAGLTWMAGGELSAPAQRLVGAPPSDLGAESVIFPSKSGSQIHGWFTPGAPERGAVLLLHGVRGDRRDMVSRAEFLHRLGYAVLLIDFQAHGESPGDRITFGDRESRDVVAALLYLRQRAPGERVGALGVSSGAASLVLAEGRPHVDAVILESMYPTIEQAVADRLRLYLGSAGPVLAPLLLAQFRPRLGTSVERLRPIDRIGSLGAPVLILSGTVDQHTTIEEARAIFAAAHPPKEFWAVEGAAHVDLHAYAKAEYERRVAAFLGAHLAAPAGASASIQQRVP